ncbi:MAG TPA: class I SAM-dependent methyltransferase [Stellaceae bacterium]|nr:class I SAM-dependent methyltransferase [Stellaceae bacterium]
MDVLTSRRLGYELRAAPAHLSEGARGKLFVYPDGGASLHRLSITAPRELCAEAVLHIAPRGRDYYLNLNLAHATGHGTSIAPYLTILSEPFELSASALVTTVKGDTHVHIADVVPDANVAWPLDVRQWIPIYGQPYETGLGRSFDAHALSRTAIATIHNRWPSLRASRFELRRDKRIPVPEEKHRRRVAGPTVDSDPDGGRFISGGEELLKAVLNIADVYAPQTLSRVPARILDWGVGCGRLARHLPKELQKEFVGADIDPVNIAWCKENLPFGTFEVLDPFERTRFRSEEFDLIYSHSVLTHLSEADQFFWLQELNRICSGIMVLSVNGSYHAATVASWGTVDHAWFQYLERGFHDSMRPSFDISDVVADGYYRGAAHTPRYIYEFWNKVVDVLDIIPGGFGRTLDAVVCRPRRTAPSSSGLRRVIGRPHRL